jgi:hypothetical protein
MAYILSHDLGFEADTLEDFERQKQKWNEYAEYLESVRNRLPKSAFEFAIASWRHNEDHRCLHDSWVQYVTISESSLDAGHPDRSLEIQVRLLGPYHDGHTRLTYHQVQSYSLDSPLEFKLPPLGVGHGDWLRDEVRLSKNGFVLHEIEFSRGSRWMIECRDIDWAWGTDPEQQSNVGIP